ncbi:Iron sulfur cluster assembly protein 1, mitochondrial [Hordeum vulgare]|nr:Iron sulfur cluster assembly protein 1, mitochondrial [Hordeum vulgare]
MVISMDPSPTPQAPSGHMTRARARAIETEVTPVLNDCPFDSLGTWMLPQSETLCMLRYHEDDLEDALSEDQAIMKMGTKRDEEEH